MIVEGQTHNLRVKYGLPYLVAESTHLFNSIEGNWAHQLNIN